MVLAIGQILGCARRSFLPHPTVVVDFPDLDIVLGRRCGFFW